MAGWSNITNSAATWSASTDSPHNWSVLSSIVSSTDSLSVMFHVVADDEHAITAMDDISGWRANDQEFNNP